MHEESTAMSDRELLIRIDERTASLIQQMDSYVLKEEFQPVQAIAYGLVSVILMAVAGAVIATVLRKPRNNFPNTRAVQGA